MSETVHVEFDLTVSRPVNSRRVGSWLRARASVDPHVEKLENVTVSERAIVLDAIVALLNAEDNAATTFTALKSCHRNNPHSRACLGSFTCGEAEMVARFMRAYGRADDAASWLAVHARSDNDESDEHHDLYLAQQVQR